ncbi:multidrug effflux MFS transporter [Phreatobacter aquaticus]|uniref:Bcr/CflA family efflux transporter n=1 Tax=Phreatobacter aquaticus TaxID=2570229 RepID=A0A4D7QNY7_9HYPH|nr:multidrug effflux MFS transporter [Phreatobacter aquaticus]QCK85852.1 multidrug effflux MFS transporter [Phreatobacter aquaticus]
MAFRPDTFALTALLAMLISMGPVSTDLYLPSLPDIGRVLGATTAQVQLTLSAFLVGFAAGQILYGPVSDKYGRKPVLVIALVLYGVGTALCAAAQSIETLTAARCLQALGAAGPIVVARAIVRDLYEGRRAARELALMGTFMSVMPAIAPIFGGVLHVAFGWRSTFAIMLIYAACALVLVMVQLPETLRERSTAPISPIGILRTFGTIVVDRTFLANTLIFAAGYSGLFSFISSSSFILQGVYGLGPIGAGASFSTCVIGFVSGSIIGTPLVARLGEDMAIRIGIGLQALGALAMAAALGIGGLGLAGILAPMAAYTLGFGITMPQTLSAAMKPFPDKAGAASSLAGFIQMSSGAIAGVFVGHALGNSAWPLAAALGVTASIAVGTYLANRFVQTAR